MANNSWTWANAWATVAPYIPGLTGGAGVQPEPPPKVVLVPPFFQRDVRGLSRFCRSSYDYLASRKQLSRLLRDHLQPEVRGGLLLSPPDDQRVSVRARLRHGGGSMVLRWQPGGAAQLHTFLELAAALDSPGHVQFRAAYLHPHSGLGAFVVAPLLSAAGAGAAAAGAGAGGGDVGGGVGGGGSAALSAVGLPKAVTGPGAGAGAMGGPEPAPAAAAAAAGTCAPQVGVRYSSEALAAGAIVSASGGGGGAELERAWLAARTPQGLTLGLELRPAAPLHQLAAAAAEGLAALRGGSSSSSGTGAAAPAHPDKAGTTTASTSSSTPSASPSPPAAAAVLPPLAHLGGWLRARSSLLLAYSPPAHHRTQQQQQQQQGAAGGSSPASPGSSSFTAAVEVAGGRRVTFSFFQHVAATRQVVNPFEENEVVGITNYLDLGLQLTTAVGSGGQQQPPTAGAASPPKQPASSSAGGAAPSSSAAPSSAGPATAAASSVDLAASWQINKNWIVKARVGSESAAAAIGVRAWHVVSAYLTASVGLDWATRTPRYGAELCVENWGPLRYERGAADVAAGRALLQRHEASPQELANRAGRGVLVRRNVDADLAAAAAVAARGGELEAERQRVAALM
ncbi:hypothetical protein HYH02_013516 [Chlamydomonas schloesseri]|uniref:Uncharacterized protein n=1 Tax=Chlamydomonas schloesseri TaxID=2026947 RepID=A0A835SZB4_9CHLO|nr:hypothetical protein HYH02_013516 [Chlamydomonas schloesseri]|eukprot:KAG2430984.1 hypothetical protein HYH02_013516 [Chlamydomonas schloesseri]